MNEATGMLAKIVAAWINGVAAEVDAERRAAMAGILRDIGDTDLELVVSVKGGTVSLHAVNPVNNKRALLHQESLGRLSPVDGFSHEGDDRMQ